MPSRLLLAKNGKKFFIRDITKDYHCQFGFITAADLKKKFGSVTTNKGVELNIIESQFIDLYQKIKRGPQIVAPKDIASIIIETGMNKNSVVVDAGGGSGALCLYMAHICKKVTTYELREDFTEILESNKKFLELKNVTIKNKDICDGISEKNVDVITLDLAEPWKVVSHAEKALKHGGFLVSYSPTVPQIADFINALKDTQFIHLKTKEILERLWECEERKVRPFTHMLAHTGFLTFCRRL